MDIRAGVHFPAHRARNEPPFVVAMTSLMSPQRRLPASAYHSHDAPSSVRKRWPNGRSIQWLSRRDINVEELKAFVRDWIEISTPQESLMEENVYGGRECPGVLPLEQDYRPHILLPPKDEFGLSFAAHGRAPDRKRHADQEAHGTHAHEQCRHCISACAPGAKALTLWTDPCSCAHGSFSRFPERLSATCVPRRGLAQINRE